MEELLEATRCPIGQKVPYTAFKLSGEAKRWLSLGKGFFSFGVMPMLLRRVGVSFFLAEKMTTVPPFNVDQTLFLKPSWDSRLIWRLRL
ncbi:hypothetical protein SLA2020_452720 [Shorea laevis]